MISNLRVEAAHPSINISLAPFGASHLRDTLPLPSAILQHQATRTAAFFANATPEEILAGEAERPAKQTWGIFLGWSDTPQDFMGTVALTAKEPQDSDVARGLLEPGTVLFRTEALGKGIGTLTTLAALKLVFDAGTPGSYARTAPWNMLGQASLGKMGFTRFGSVPETTTFANGHTGCLQEWLLLSDPELAFGHPTYASLCQGAQKYLKAVEDISVRTVDGI